ncbi:MAG: prolyl oligopeptidase family serine peptidase [Flavobacteriaceae bacterium]|jgi:dipeptidyl aminopeptidase/acylaminoacyl peptidase|nr:prolyl oligopeptidase family serine peptidase [Flavobacteriaceae bacterium]
MKTLRFFTIILFFMNLNLEAQENLTYQKPSPEILQLADYERAPQVIMNSKKEWLVFSYSPTYKSLDDLNQEEMRLGGLRVNPVTNISSTITYTNNLKLKKIGEKKETQIKNLPENPKIAYISFSPDEKKIAFTNTTAKGVELWVIDLETRMAKQLSEDNLNANLGQPYVWFKNSESLLAKTLQPNRATLLDEKKNLPAGPIISESDGKISQNRTYQDLLKNPMDEANFEILTQSELVKIDLNGKKEKFLEKNIYSQINFSPDGNYILISTIHKPFSYIVPLNRFPVTFSVYDLTGKSVKIVNEKPLNEILPKGFSSTFTGKRNLSWCDDKPATLFYVEALDGGDQANESQFRDELFSWDFPFDKTPESLMKTEQRFAGIEWGNADYAVVYDMWYDTRSLKTYLLNPTKKTLKLLSDRNFQDIYNDPGNFATEKNKFDRYIIEIQDDKTHLIGEGFTEKGQFPFIDEFDLKTLTKKRIYTSDSQGIKEEIFDLINIKKGEILVRQQSKNKFPNYFEKNIKTGKISQLTDFQNPFGSIANIYKEVIHYKRNDGVDLKGTLYLPENYDFINKPKLPLLIWAYPEEYKDKATAGQSAANPNEFTYPYYGSFVYWVAKGYAVLDDASFPIVGEGNTEPNDTFIEQLVADGRAAIDAVDKLGYIDRTKVAAGGHSYGAFMTANLLTYSDDFACGIARSGAYNRTLTPFGFQSEQRNYWDAPEIYDQMSPFMHADKMKKPLLLVHGEADNNPGTFTLQTERYFQALKNLGAPVRLVILPKESHSYQAKENILHLLWEQDRFLEKCLKLGKVEN